MRVIPNKVVLAGAIAAIAIAAVTDPSSLDERAIAAVAAGGVLFVSPSPTRGGWGWAM